MLKDCCGPSGNYIFYDVTQWKLGSCDVSDIAVRVLTRVIGHYAHSNTLIVDMGWTAQGGGQVGSASLRRTKMSSLLTFVFQWQGSEASYGCFTNAPDLKVVELKQEIGEVSTLDGSPLDYQRFPVGSVLAFAPYHSCATTHCHPSISCINSHGEIVGNLQRASGW